MYVVRVWCSQKQKKKPAGAPVYFLDKSAVLCDNFKLIFFYFPVTLFLLQAHCATILTSGYHALKMRVGPSNDELLKSSSDELLSSG